jgi:hypothetical protein
MRTTMEPPDFSLALGGPLFQLYRRTHLSGDALELLFRRVAVITLFAWLPLLFLSMLDGQALDHGLKIPFLYDVEAHVRFLVALPLLIVAEVIVHQRIGPLVRRFAERRIVVSEDMPKFIAAINSAVRARNSVALEVTLIVLVYTVGLWIWKSHIAVERPTWYAIPDIGHLHLTLAGYWFAFVSIPIFQFILLRWYMRLVLWFRLLWQISRLNLHLSAAHPDQAGGIGFLGRSSYAFAPILFAQGTLLSGLIASRVLYEGRGLLSFKMEAVGFVLFFVLIILGPLVMFTPQLSRAKYRGSAEYGLLANRFVFGFEDKWIQASAPETSELLQTADIRSLVAVGRSYEMVRGMRLVPFAPNDITVLAATTAAPLLPLALTTFSVGQVLTFLIRTLFK